MNINNRSSHNKGKYMTLVESEGSASGGAMSGPGPKSGKVSPSDVEVGKMGVHADESTGLTDGSAGSGPPSFRKTWAIGVLVSIVAGFGMGWAMNKAQVYDPIIVRDQFAYTNWIMVKMFAAAMSATLLSLGFVSLAAPKTFATTMKGAWTNDRGVVSAGIGGALIGMGGFVIAGSCPGTVYAQLGGAVSNTPFTFAGAITGALLYGIVHPFLSGAARGSGEPNAPAPFNFLTWGAPATPTLDKVLGVHYAMLAIPAGLVVAGVAVMLEFVVPAADDLPAGISMDSGNIFVKEAWPATASGALIGAMQIPMVLLAKKTIGASTSFVIFLSSLLHIVVPESILAKPAFAYFHNKHALTKSGFQMFFVLAVVLGSLTSGSAADTFNTVKGVKPYQGFLGGMIMLFGARLGGGCTSGHGLSGASKLQFASFASIIGMFGAASGLGLLWAHA